MEHKRDVLHIRVRTGPGSEWASFAGTTESRFNNHPQASKAWGLQWEYIL